MSSENKSSNSFWSPSYQVPFIGLMCRTICSMLSMRCLVLIVISIVETSWPMRVDPIRWMYTCPLSLAMSKFGTVGMVWERCNTPIRMRMLVGLGIFCLGVVLMILFFVWWRLNDWIKCPALIYKGCLSVFTCFID